MTRLLSALSAALFFTACTASSDETSTTSDEVSTTCPQELVLTLDGYAAETLPDLVDGDFAAWHAANAERENVETTATGLQFKVIQPGIENGVVPMPGEGITAYYHGYFPNGEEFDSIYTRGEPMTHVSNGLIKGWNEALADMKVCEARTLYVPADLAYGNGGGGRPSGTLVFHMQLLSVNR